MTSSVRRRASLAHLYEKIRALKDEDDMAWLAQYSPDDEPYVPTVRRPALSKTSSASLLPSRSSSSSFSDPVFDNDSGDDHFDSDSGDDVGPEPLSLDTEFDPTPFLPLLLQIDSTRLMEPTKSTDSSCIPSEISQQSSTRSFSPDVSQDVSEDTNSESGNGSEDEYIPSPTLCSRKRRKPTRSAPSAAVTWSLKRNAENGPRKPGHSPQPRNVQAAPGTIPASSTAKKNPWACPYCTWVQRNHRTPDLKRHIRTHTRLHRPPQWVCCGVPADQATYYNILADTKAYIWGDDIMLGGCRKEFSRRDALKRHLDNDHIGCIGNFAAFANICEDEI